MNESNHNAIYNDYTNFYKSVNSLNIPVVLSVLPYGLLNLTNTIIGGMGLGFLAWFSLFFCTPVLVYLYFKVYSMDTIYNHQFNTKKIIYVTYVLIAINIVCNVLLWGAAVFGMTRPDTMQYMNINAIVFLEYTSGIFLPIIDIYILGQLINVHALINKIFINRNNTLKIYINAELPNKNSKNWYFELYGEEVNIIRINIEFYRIILYLYILILNTYCIWGYINKISVIVCIFNMCGYVYLRTFREYNKIIQIYNYKYYILFTVFLIQMVFLVTQNRYSITTQVAFLLNLIVVMDIKIAINKYCDKYASADSYVIPDNTFNNKKHSHKQFLEAKKQSGRHLLVSYIIIITIAIQAVAFKIFQEHNLYNFTLNEIVNIFSIMTLISPMLISCVAYNYINYRLNLKLKEINLIYLIQIFILSVSLIVLTFNITSYFKGEHSFYMTTTIFSIAFCMIMNIYNVFNLKKLKNDIKETLCVQFN